MAQELLTPDHAVMAEATRAPVSDGSSRTELAVEEVQAKRRYRRLALWLIAALLLITARVTLVAASGGVIPDDVVIARAVQEISVPGAGYVAWVGNTAGRFEVALSVTLVTTLVLVGARRRAEALLVASAALAWVVNPLLKALADSPRPPGADASWLGFPSGHAMGAFLIFGMIAYVAQGAIRRRSVRLLVQAVAVGLILATGFGRVYTGVHWPSDVLGELPLGHDPDDRPSRRLPLH